MEKAEQLVCRPIVQLFPFVGVNVVHHQINIFLLKLVQRGALRNDASNEFMRDLNTALFVRAAWVTVEHKTAQVPIIFITAKDTENDTVTGFNLGADDYISKPFSLREVIARVKAVLRRTATSDTEKAPEQLCYQSLVIDITKKKVSIDGEEVPLTKKEFEILFLLLQNKGRVFSREDILSRIWSDEVYVLDRTIDVNITRLRKKIGTYGKRIVTRLGYGYCFETE